MLKLAHAAALGALLFADIANSQERQIAPVTAMENLEAYAKPQRLVALGDGRRLNLYCTGIGTPTVLLEGGWTVTTLWWRTIQSRVSLTTRVCSYDRSGYGFSDPGPLPRSAAPIAADLRALLKAANVAGPYLIVAHSLGALDGRIFADQQPKAVKGMLLIDPTVPHQVERMGAASASYAADMARLIGAVAKCSHGILEGTIAPDTPQGRACIDPPSKGLSVPINTSHRAKQMTPGYQRTALSELESLARSSQEVETSRRSYGAMPLIVMTAGKANDNPDLAKEEQMKLDAAWWQLHEEIVSLSTRGSHVLIPNASHFIPKDNPDAVVAAIVELVGKSRAKR